MHYIPTADRQQFTFLQSLDDLVSAEHPVRIIDEIVESIIAANPEGFSIKGQSNVGRRAYSPNTMVKLYIYGYINGISSSRKLETETHRNIELIWLLGDLRPDFKTIADYRKDNGEQIKRLTIKFREFLRDRGFIKGKRVAVDGTKVKAYTNRDMITMEKIERRINTINNNIEDYLQRLMENDLKEDLMEQFGGEDGSEINQELVDKIAELEERVRELEEQKKYLEDNARERMSPADPDAELMLSRDGKIPSYNVQLMVDDEHKLIAGTLVTTAPNDSDQLVASLETLEEELAITPEEILADKGYGNFAAIEEVEGNEKTSCYIPIIKNHYAQDAIRFRHDKSRDEYKCSEGGRLVLRSRNKVKRGQIYDVYQGIECDKCRLREKCTSSPRGRILHRAQNESWRQAYLGKLKSPRGKANINRRKCLVEHPIGTLRYWMGKIPLLLRGKVKVAIEIDIYATAYNLKRLINIESHHKLRESIREYGWSLS